VNNILSRALPLDRSATFPAIGLGAASVLCLGIGALIAGGVLATLTAAVLFFFRDPHRRVPSGRDSIVSPADGTVVEIEEHPMPVIGAPSTRVAIFLSIFDVHVNRAPCSGVISEVHYQPGNHMDARVPASTMNESNLIVIRTGTKHVGVRQIAGRIARRVVCRVQPGQRVQRGQRIGVIKFGSRVEICVPADSELKVEIGDHVWGGRSILASLASE